MGEFRWRDLVLVPSLLSFMRIPLAMLFPFVLTSRPAALAILCLAGASDVLDGWYARRFGQATTTGAVVDPVTDKLFVLAVVTTLVIAHILPLMSVLLLSTREIGETPLIFWFFVNQRLRRARATKAAANLPGKLATGFQFLTIAAALLRARYTHEMLLVTAGAGAVAAVVYWMRELAALRQEPLARSAPMS
jgi:CDP-diacylglycerol--glycerol-3-phosphate 3-phosphatidyltransferase/cardiolipin synthase